MALIVDNPPDPKPAPETFIGAVRMLNVGQAVEADMTIGQARTVASKVKAETRNVNCDGKEFNTYEADSKIYIKRVA